MRDSAKTVIGIFAHADAGKTTLSEALLYETGAIRSFGRVDQRNTFLDTYGVERARGITVFSKPAEFSAGGRAFVLLDTPGHADFSPEMERALSVTDAAVLVISQAQGVEPGTKTLLKLFDMHRVPFFIFVNKMDQAGADRTHVMSMIKAYVPECADMTGFGPDENGKILCGQDAMEDIASCDEALLEGYLAGRAPDAADVRRLVGEKKLVPVIFGAALRRQSVGELMRAIELFTKPAKCGDSFAARVIKITRDEKNARLTHLRILGGSLKVREAWPGDPSQKISQIRIYSGDRFESVQEAEAGCVCAVPGLSGTAAGDAIGEGLTKHKAALEPVLTYDISAAAGTDGRLLWQHLKLIEEEKPEIGLFMDDESHRMRVSVFGQVGLEILQGELSDRFGDTVNFGAGEIIYREAPAASAYGAGHFEPLRHYAEVHVFIEPLPRGSGLQVETACSTDVLASHWQHTVLSELSHRQHRGVLTGSRLTDARITLVAGRAHIKHSESGDFAQAARRAVRQALMEAGCLLLEPYCSFELRVPKTAVGRAMSELERLGAEFSLDAEEEELSILKGKGPVSRLWDHAKSVAAYTGGLGSFSSEPAGFLECSDAERVVEEKAYDPEADASNPAGSVFCAGGAGYSVPWDKVMGMIHVPPDMRFMARASSTTWLETEAEAKAPRERLKGESLALDKELDEIFLRTFGRHINTPPKRTQAEKIIRTAEEKSPAYLKKPGYMKKDAAKRKEYLLVDGYNIIYAWPELKKLAADRLSYARDLLVQILDNYRAYAGMELILVFDAYKVPGGSEHREEKDGISIVYTKEAQTADQYIEKTAHELGRTYRVTVATSDGAEQVIIRGQGCLLMSAADLLEDVGRVNRLIGEQIEAHT